VALLDPSSESATVIVGGEVGTVRVYDCRQQQQAFDAFLETPINCCAANGEYGIFFALSVCFLWYSCLLLPFRWSVYSVSFLLAFCFCLTSSSSALHHKSCLGIVVGHQDGLVQFLDRRKQGSASKLVKTLSLVLLFAWGFLLWTKRRGTKQQGWYLWRRVERVFGDRCTNPWSLCGQLQSLVQQWGGLGDASVLWGNNQVRGKFHCI